MADSEEQKTELGRPLKDWMRRDLLTAGGLLEDGLERVRKALRQDDAVCISRSNLRSSVDAPAHMGAVRDSITDALSDAKEASGYLHMILERFDED